MLHRIVEPVSRARCVARPELRLVPGALAVGQGATFGILGGCRTMMADLVWLRAYLAWERRDAPATETLLKLASVLDPHPIYFWLNGARIMAYDMPAWEIAAAGGPLKISPTQQALISAVQARRALGFLDEAMIYHPANAALWIERANIELNRLHETAAAAESYRRASQQPDAPYFAARLHAELLRRLGRKIEALAWLVDLHPRLPSNVEAAAADVVLARIRELERELAVPIEQIYRAPAR